MLDATSVASIVFAPDACARRWTLLAEKDASRYFDSKDISVNGKSPTETASMCLFFVHIQRRCADFREALKSASIGLTEAVKGKTRHVCKIQLSHMGKKIKIGLVR